MNSTELEALDLLAREAGLETSFYDGLGRLCRPSPESLLAILERLGVSLASPSESREALRSLRMERAAQVVEPVVVGREGLPLELELRLPVLSSPNTVEIRLEFEDQQRREFQIPIQPDTQAAQQEIEGRSFALHRIRLPHPLPMGYHRLALEFGEEEFEVLCLATPDQVSQGDPDHRKWGLFLPVYSLRSAGSWGVGGYSEMKSWIEWISSQKGSFLGTLPLFPSFLDHPFDPSPYSPVSRLFWNEFYLDPTASPEWESCPAARELFDSTEFQRLRTELREAPLVDYRVGMAARRRLLERLAECFFESGADRSEPFRHFLSERVQDYARFRASHERQGRGWQNWPEAMRSGRLTIPDYDQKSYRYHLYTQWLAHQQIETIRSLSHSHDVRLYLDLPLGVHPDGFDVWNFQSTFALGCCGGSPPDVFFRSGQNWGFPPFHPVRQRQQRYRYMRESLRHLMRFSDLLRIDHVMSLHRLYWIPKGAPAAEGVYVHYPAEELYAVLAIESRRCGCLVVGEDLGTVPPIVRETMEARGMHRMYVGLFELQSRPDQPFNPLPESVVASLNTHDTPTFSGFWQGSDIADRREMGLLDDETARLESEHRRLLREALLAHLNLSGDPFSVDLQLQVLRRWLHYLAESQARFLLINVEDLWLEIEPQNVPGTTSEKPNWRRKSRFLLEDLCKVPGLVDTLKEIDRKRRASEQSAMKRE